METVSIRIDDFTNKNIMWYKMLPMIMELQQVKWQRDVRLRFWSKIKTEKQIRASYKLFVEKFKKCGVYGGSIDNPIISPRNNKYAFWELMEYEPKFRQTRIPEGNSQNIEEHKIIFDGDIGKCIDIMKRGCLIKSFSEENYNILDIFDIHRYTFLYDNGPLLSLRKVDKPNYVDNRFTHLIDVAMWVYEQRKKILARIKLSI